MKKQLINNTKLGFFVLAGLLFLILLLYMIGRNRSLFGSNYLLKTRFENVQGLIPGNNVRYAGIQAGTVKHIEILNDTTVEVTMIIDTEMEHIIRKDAITAIGTDGLVGNKVVNIVPGKLNTSIAKKGDILPSKKPIDTEKILNTLSKTNNDVSIIVTGLKTTVERINNSSAIWELLNDDQLPNDIKKSAKNIQLATLKAAAISNEFQLIVNDLRNGNGSLGILLNDTVLVSNLNKSSYNLNMVSLQLHKIVSDLQKDINSGKGPVNSLLKDSLMVKKLNISLDNIQMGTDGFNQSMDALKNSFLLRGYFKRREKEKVKNDTIPK
ncbi:MlaD family protein [Daejeonella sp.]|jgi:phospholipid/cholesterol/gamma-HCH transport system substrate-binding protein|uniref:MlaD family protein n=1 Tax=Daejeonella sp. TaxID=2805397 RepID=UPI0037BE629D